MGLVGTLVRTRDRAALGHVTDLLADPESGTAQWLEVRIDDGSAVLVPAAAASEASEGEVLVPYDLTHAIAASHDLGQTVTPDEAAWLRRHYGFQS